VAEGEGAAVEIGATVAAGIVAVGAAPGAQADPTTSETTRQHWRSRARTARGRGKLGMEIGAP
jgi:hypothetical protein